MCRTKPPGTVPCSIEHRLVWCTRRGVSPTPTSAHLPGLPPHVDRATRAIQSSETDLQALPRQGRWGRCAAPMQTVKMKGPQPCVEFRHPHPSGSLTQQRDSMPTQQGDSSIRYIYLAGFFPSPHNLILLALSASNASTPIIAWSSYGSSWAYETGILATLLTLFQHSPSPLASDHKSSL